MFISHTSNVPYRFQIILSRATLRPFLFLLSPKLSIVPLRLYTEAEKWVRSLGGKPEGERTLGRPRRRWEDMAFGSGLRKKKWAGVKTVMKIRVP